jgi:hypothetical protein
MAWENRLPLDVMLAEKGGVCIMTRVLCVASIYQIIQPHMELLLRPYKD